VNRSGFSGFSGFFGQVPVNTHCIGGATLTHGEIRQGCF